MASAGMVAKFCPDLLRNTITEASQIILQNLQYTPKEIDSQGKYVGCCANAATAAGNFALAYPNEFANFIPEFTKKIIDIYQGKVI